MFNNRFYTLIKVHLVYSLMSLTVLIISGILMEAYFIHYFNLITQEDVQYCKDLRSFSEELEKINSMFEEELKKKNVEDLQKNSEIDLQDKDTNNENK